MRLESADRHRADPTVPSRESGSKWHRPPIAATEQSASLSLWQEAGYRCFHWRHIFNRAFRNDVNAGEISLRLQAACGKTICRSTHECYGRLVSSQEAA